MLLRSSPILQTPADYKLLHIHTHKHIYAFTSPPPIPRLRRFEPPAWQALILAAGPDGWLPELDYFPCCKVVCLWCIMCFCCWGVFPVLTLYSPRSIVWGLFFFLLTFLMLCCIFLQLTLSSCPVYPLVIYVVYVWTGWWLISLVLVTSDNKGLLLLLLLHPSHFCKYFIIPFHVTTLKKWHFATM